MNATRRTTAARPRASRRGVAMLLVLVALGTATVMGSAYVASRDAAPAIAANAEVSSNAKWAAQSGANLAMAILQTSVAPSDDLTDGAIVAKAAFRLGETDAFVTNTSGEQVAATDRFYLVSAIGGAGQIGSIQQKRVIRRPTNRLTEAIDPTLPEFAAFAVDRLRVESGAFIAPWPDSVRGPSLYTANVGVAFAPPGQLSVSGASTLANARLVVSDNATASLRDAASAAPFAGGVVSDLVFPSASVRVPSALTSIAPGILGVSSVTSILPATVLPGPTANVSASSGGVVTFNGALGRNYSVHNLTANNGTIRISGDVRILVRNDFELYDRSALELIGADSRVEIYVYDDVTIANSVVGFTKSLGNNTSRTYQSVSGVVDSSRVKIFVIDTHGGGEADQVVSLSSRALVAGAIHAPGAFVDIASNSAVIGRAAARDLRMRDNASILYDHALNRGGGIADTLGPVYDPERFPVLRKALATFDNTQGLNSLIAHIVTVFEGEGVEPDPDDDARVISATLPDPRDPLRNIVVADFLGAVRAIEAGALPEATFFGATLAAGDDSTLATTVKGLASTQRSNPSTVRKNAHADKEASEGGIVSVTP